MANLHKANHTINRANHTIKHVHIDYDNQLANCSTRSLHIHLYSATSVIRTLDYPAGLAGEACFKIIRYLVCTKFNEYYYQVGSAMKKSTVTDSAGLRLSV